MSFYLYEHEAIIEFLKSADRRIGGVASFLMKDKFTNVIIRHDVDRFPSRARRLALLENQLGINTSYYFRLGYFDRFPEEDISYIYSLGHEVGYHYEDLSYCKGDKLEAMKRFHIMLERFRKIAPCLTVSMHGSPASKFDNRLLLSSSDLQNANLVGDAVLSLQQHRPLYLTDTGGSWSDKYSNLRDFVGEPWPESVKPDQEAAFAKFVIQTNRLLYINSHPERWNDNIVDFYFSKTLDKCSNLAKILIHAFRAPA